jgi:tetratricopeptide (TPR) repeat protein
VRDGIQQAGRALELLTKTHVRSPEDRCQLALFTGIFYLGISDRQRAAEEFRRALQADSSNVFAMIRLARTLYALAVIAWRNADGVYRAQLDECIETVRRILRFDRDNADGLELMEAIAREFREYV